MFLGVRQLREVFIVNPLWKCLFVNSFCLTLPASQGGASMHLWLICFESRRRVFCEKIPRKAVSNSLPSLMMNTEGSPVVPVCLEAALAVGAVTGAGGRARLDVSSSPSRSRTVAEIVRAGHSHTSVEETLVARGRLESPEDAVARLTR